MSLSRDPTLRRLTSERVGLLQQLGPVLRRTGSWHTHRAQENQRRAKIRALVRRQLRDNERAIVAHVMLLMQHLSTED